MSVVKFVEDPFRDLPKEKIAEAHNAIALLQSSLETRLFRALFELGFQFPKIEFISPRETRITLTTDLLAVEGAIESLRLLAPAKCGDSQ